MSKQSILGSSVGKKYMMALSALFLLLFLFQHFIINFTSVLPDHGKTFNNISHFMGTNVIVQFFIQPLLIIAVIYHFVMGFVLELSNRSARNVKYKVYKGNANSTWMSRNMIWSGAVILAFLVLHFIDFWIPEMQYKYIDMNGPVSDRYYEELVHKFENPYRVGLYVISFILLALHLLHGFWSAFQSIGANSPRFMPMIKAFGRAFAILIPLGFIFIALYHHFVH